jgi:hypothetical protein
VITPPLLVRWYGGLATIAALLAIQAIVLPRWPTAPRPLPVEQLEAGLRGENLLDPSDRSSPGALWPPQRSHELATSAPVVLPLRGGFELTLMRGSMRQRFNFQASSIGQAQPSLNLISRRLVGTPVPTAAGLAQGRPALQTCLVEGPGLDDGFGVTREQLWTLADRLASGQVAGLKRVIGLQPNRSYDCTLISLRGPEGKPPSDLLWRQVLDLVEPVLRSQN